MRADLEFNVVSTAVNVIQVVAQVVGTISDTAHHPVGNVSDTTASKVCAQQF